METIVLGPFFILPRADGILYISLKEDYEDITLEQMKQLTETIGKIGNGNKQKIIIDIASFNTMSEEAKKYSASAEGQIYTKANAVVINSLAAKLGANFFIKFNRPSTPTRIFNSVDEAVKWLNQIN